VPIPAVQFVDPVYAVLNRVKLSILREAADARVDRTEPIIAYQLGIIQYGLPGHEFGSGEDMPGNTAIARVRPVAAARARGPVTGMWEPSPPNEFVLTRAGARTVTVAFDFVGHFFSDECRYYHGKQRLTTLSPLMQEHPGAE
jgi:hypothetical protein